MRTMTNQTVRELQTILDETVSLFCSHDVPSAMDTLCKKLLRLRLSVSPEEWDNKMKPLCLAHELRVLLHQDPYTRRAFEKPRGYPGDAVMLDYVYRHAAPQGTTPLGLAVFKCTTGLPNGVSVRARKDYLSRMLDEVAGEFKEPRVLSVACGHLREAQASDAVKRRALKAFYALDQDAESLAVVQAEQAQAGVTPVQASVAALLRGKVTFSNLSFVYSAGLFDYLSEPLAIRLAAKMFEMLAPGGRLLIANFTPQSHGRGYMSAFMDWDLVYRSQTALARVISEIPERSISALRSSEDAYRNIAFVEVRKGDV